MSTPRIHNVQAWQLHGVPAWLFVELRLKLSWSGIMLITEKHTRRYQASHLQMCCRYLLPLLSRFLVAWVSIFYIATTFLGSHVCSLFSFSILSNLWPRYSISYFPLWICAQSHHMTYKFEKSISDEHSYAWSKGELAVSKAISLTKSALRGSTRSIFIWQINGPEQDFDSSPVDLIPTSLFFALLYEKAKC